jgi:hypothetical protein
MLEVTNRTTFPRVAASAGIVLAALGLASPAAAQMPHRGNAHSLEAKSCAQYIENRYNRRYVDRKDWRDDVERSVQITFYSVAQVPHLFKGNKFVSLKVEEFTFEGEKFAEERPLSPAYCILDSSNRVIGLEREMR